MATPTFSPPGDTFFTSEAQAVTISTATAGANIRYTKGSTLPTSSSGTLIAGSSGTVSVTPSIAGTKLNAIAFKAGMLDSAVHSDIYYYEQIDTAPTSAEPSVESASTAGGGATYDGNGNLKTYNGWTYTYDAMNRLTGAVKGTTAAYYWYDGFNRQCTWQINGNVTFSIWDGWNIVEEYHRDNPTNTSSLETSYLHGAGSDELISMTRGGQTYYFFQDGRGNTSHVANTAGQLIERYEYDVHGTPLIYAPGRTQRTASAYGVRHLFQGRDYLKETSLYDYRNRFYSPELGRFLQPDPIGFAGDGSNLYRYCGGDPVNRTDPSGLKGAFKIYQIDGPAAGLTMLGGADWHVNGGGLSNYDRANLASQERNGFGAPLGPGNGIFVGYVGLDNPRTSGGSAILRAQPADPAQAATAALDSWAAWAYQHQREVAGTINSRGDVLVGPEDRRTLERSHPGTIAGNTVAIWHLHHLVGPNPYIFSYPPNGNDTFYLTRYPNLSHYVGVLNAPPGEFTIFAQTPERPYHHFTRLGPYPHPRPPGG